ncbi:MAG TPA: site-specific DNA-methyltransferase [Acholeplasmataceae bacterium]|jgi:site-specific DNA-methyltransferase (adenine-specific)|nr:site-specific DNA-methyltransferase [Acholeplasmataceae bacterium]
MKINNIYLEDVFDFLKKVDNESIDLAIIDPPYNQKIDDWDTFKSEKKYFDFTYKWLDLTIDKLKPNGSLYIFNNTYNSAFILTYLVSKGLLFKNWIVWYKKDGFSPSRRKFVNNQEVILFFTKGEKYTFNYNDVRVPYLSTSRINAAKKTGILKNGKRWFPNENGRLCPDVWEIPSVRLTEKVNGKTIKTLHPTPKPESMIERMIKASSNPGDLVLDLFSGSGTTAYVAKQLDRNFIGCENNLDYFEYIQERLRDEKE